VALFEGPEPQFLTLDEVLELHTETLRRHGGAPGLRDEHMLLSALAQAEASFGGVYLHRDLFEMAAAYLFHLCQNHPFADGNKRIAFAASTAFLYLNGIGLTASQQESAQLVLSVARGETQKSAIAEFLRLNCKVV
jgi:death-on-curing protein